MIRFREVFANPSNVLKYGVVVLTALCSYFMLVWWETNIGAAAHVPVLLCIIFFNTWYGGTRAGLFSTILSLLVFAYILPPGNSLAFEISQLPRLLFFAISALIIVSLCGKQKRSEQLLKRSEERLRRSEEHLRLVIDSTPAMIWSAEPDGSVDFINKVWKEFTGLSVENLLGWKWTSIIHPDDRERLLGEWRQSLATGKTLDEEARLQRVHGDYRLLAIRAVPLHDESGTIIKWYGTKTDITESKRVEAELRNDEIKLRTIIDTLPVGITINDATGDIIQMNASLPSILELSSEDLRHAKYRERKYIHSDGSPMTFDDFPSTIAMKEQRVVKDKEVGVVMDGGRILWTSVSASPLPIEGLGAVIVTTNITERKQTQDELKAQKEVLQTIFDHIPLMISLVDRDGDFKIVNREWERVQGWALKEVQQNNIDVVAQLFPERHEQERVRAFMKNSVGQWTDFKTHVRDGRVIDTRWIRVRISDGTSIGIGQDISDSKKTEEVLQDLLRHYKTLFNHLQTIREEERSRMSMEIHDELGQKLTSLKLDLVWLESKIPAKDEDLIIHYRAMLGLIDSIVGDIQRMSSELRPGVLDNLGLAAALEWQAAEFRRRTNIRCTFTRLDEITGLNRKVSTATFRIFQEALTNVARHSEATEVSIQLIREDDMIRLTISDDGKGITPEQINNFNSLGIMSMKERATALEGKLTIEGSRNNGTTIRLVIPCV
jgi:PAS domain S-box-containing protein